MILTDLFESQKIHDQDRLDGVLGRCIELIHEKNAANPKKYGRVAACIIDMKNRKVFGINSPGADGRRRHAERMAIDAYHKRYGKILPGAIIVTTLSPCNRDMLERDGPSCQDLLMQAGIEKVYSGYMDPSQHSEHPFTEEVTKNDDLWRQCKEFSDSFVHDDLTESQHNTMKADQVLDYVNRLHHDFDIEYSITDHPEWELKMIPLRQLHLDPDGEEQDPYNRVNWVDYDKVRDLIPKIGSVLKSSPIVVDSQGWIIDGNHRAAAAVEAGLTSVPALVPVEQLQEFARTGDDGREFMSWPEFLAIVTPAMRGWGFGVENKQPQIMYSRRGRGQGEYYIIILDPQEDMVQYSFMTMDGDQPEMHETNFVGMDRNGAHSLLAKIDEGYSLSDIKRNMAEDTPLPGDFKLMGQDLFLENLARNLKQRYPDATVKRSSDRVVAYYNKEDDDYLTVMGTEIMDGGYIGIGLDDAFTHSFQGVLVPTIKQTTEQLLAANPGTRPALFLSTDNWNPDAWTHIATKLGYRLVADDEELAENKQPGKPVVDAILKVMPLAQEIWFHGSRAIGRHRNDSDTDILVVVPEDLVGDKYLGVVRILQKLSSHFDNHDIQPTKAGTNIHRIAQEEGRLLWSKNQGVTENFADGRVKGKSRPGRVKRAGASCAGSVTDLRAKAKKYGGERGRMYHWCANMKGGKK